MTRLLAVILLAALCCSYAGAQSRPGGAKSASVRASEPAALKAAEPGRPHGVAPASAEQPATQSAPAPDYAGLKAQISRFDSLLVSALLGMFETRAFVILGQPKSTYLEGYGVVIQAELNLYPMVGIAPFMSKEALDAEIKREEENRPLRLKALRNRLRELLAEHGAALTLLGSGESIAVVVHLFNARPTAVMPSQVVVQARREALLELASESKASGHKPEPAALARAITLREF